MLGIFRSLLQSRSRSLRVDLSRQQLIAAFAPLLVLTLSYVAYSATTGHRDAVRTTTAIANQWHGSLKSSLTGFESAVSAGAALASANACTEGECRDIVLKTILTASPGLRSASFIDAKGIVTRFWFRNGRLISRRPDLEGSDVSDREYFRRARDERASVISQPYVARVLPRETVIGFAMPIPAADSQFAGLIHASVSVGAISREAERLVDGRFKDARFLLTDSLNRVIASDVPTLATGTDAAHVMPAAVTAATGVTRTPDGRLMYFGELPFERLGWHMTVFIPASIVISGAMTFIAFLLASVVVAVAIAWRNGLRLARALSSPMEELAEEIEALTLENADSRNLPAIPETKVDEIRRIRGAAQNLAVRLGKANEDVQSTIAIQKELNHQLESVIRDRDLEISVQTSQLRTALHEAEAAVSARNRLLANTSHELRTPLQGIIGSAELLLHGGLSPEQQNHVVTVLRCGEGMLQLINDLLDLARLRTGSILLDVRPFKISDEMATIAEGSLLLAAQRGLYLEIEVETGTHQHWAGDATRLRQVLFNLITNAIKFTEVGKISLIVRQLSDRTLRFEVHDTGLGIAEDDRERIFEPFVQVDSESSRWFQGTGLGLAISRQLISLMQGTLWVESALGHGSHFYCEIPFERLEQSQILSETLHYRDDIRPGPSVLLVEDNEVNAEVIQAQLKAIGVPASSVNDGFHALQYLSTHACELVLLDCQMPGMDGYEVARRIRQYWPERRLAIVAVTAHASDSERDHCVAAGMNDYLPKPLRLASLRTMLEKYLAGTEQAE